MGLFLFLDFFDECIPGDFTWCRHRVAPERSDYLLRLDVMMRHQTQHG